MRRYMLISGFEGLTVLAHKADKVVLKCCYKLKGWTVKELYISSRLLFFCILHVTALTTFDLLLIFFPDSYDNSVVPCKFSIVITLLL